jgi:transcriptional regulator with XRE-family HTH domain
VTVLRIFATILSGGMNMNTFENNLQRLRKLRNMKQEELAQRINVSRQTISGWETGRRQPDLDTLKKLAEVLEVDIHELIYGSMQGEYPKFQRKYVFLTVLFGGIVAFLLLFRLLVWPHFKILCATYHWGSALFVCHYVLPPVGFFAFGALFPALVQLFVPVRIGIRWAILLLVGGCAVLMPVILFWFGILRLSTKFLFSIGIAFISYVLPFVSGVCVTMGYTCKMSGNIK